MPATGETLLHRLDCLASGPSLAGGHGQAFLDVEEPIALTPFSWVEAILRSDEDSASPAYAKALGDCRDLAWSADGAYLAAVGKSSNAITLFEASTAGALFVASSIGGASEPRLIAPSRPVLLAGWWNLRHFGPDGSCVHPRRLCRKSCFPLRCKRSHTRRGCRSGFGGRGQPGIYRCPRCRRYCPPKARAAGRIGRSAGRGDQGFGHIGRVLPNLPASPSIRQPPSSSWEPKVTTRSTSSPVPHRAETSPYLRASTRALFPPMAPYPTPAPSHFRPTVRVSSSYRITAKPFSASIKTRVRAASALGRELKTALTGLGRFCLAQAYRPQP